MLVPGAAPYCYALPLLPAAAPCLVLLRAAIASCYCVLLLRALSLLLLPGAPPARLFAVC